MLSNRAASESQTSSFRLPRSAVRALKLFVSTSLLATALVAVLPEENNGFYDRADHTVVQSAGTHAVQVSLPSTIQANRPFVAYVQLANRGQTPLTLSTNDIRVESLDADNKPVARTVVNGQTFADTVAEGENIGQLGKAIAHVFHLLTPSADIVATKTATGGTAGAVAAQPGSETLLQMNDALVNHPGAVLGTPTTVAAQSIGGGRIKIQGPLLDKGRGQITIVVPLAGETHTFTFDLKTQS